MCWALNRLYVVQSLLLTRVRSLWLPVQLVEMLKILLSTVWFKDLLAILSLQDVMCNVKTSTKNVKAVKNIGKVRIK